MRLLGFTSFYPTYKIGDRAEDCLPIEDLVRSEIVWVLQSGIDLIGDIVEVESER